MRQRALSWTGIGAAALLLAVPIASAAEISRDEYVARAEPICKANVLANRRIFKRQKSR